jgi:hypothetical protein
MTGQDLHYFRQWFAEYVKSFYTPDEGDNRNIEMKETHSLHVCENILRIAGEERLDENRAMMAETIGLFHDVGRFPQYAVYGTFRDSISVNHGEFGARVLAENAVLSALPERERHIIMTAVKFHNAFRVPDLQDNETEFFLKMIRDADKLDIWRIFFEYYGKPEDERPSAAGIGLPDIPGYSPEVLERIFNKQLIPLTMLRTLNDFKLTQLSWMYDLNFAVSFTIITAEDYINRIACTLPQTEEIKRMVAFLHDYIKEKIKETGNG